MIRLSFSRMVNRGLVSAVLLFPYATYFHPNCLEMVQRHGACFVLNRYHNTSSVSDMLSELQWDILEETWEGTDCPSSIKFTLVTLELMLQSAMCLKTSTFTRHAGCLWLRNCQQGYTHHMVKYQCPQHHLNGRTNPPQTHDDLEIVCIYNKQAVSY